MESNLRFADLDFSGYVERKPRTVRGEYKAEWNGDRDIIYEDIDWVKSKGLQKTREQLEAYRAQKLAEEIKSDVKRKVN